MKQIHVLGLSWQTWATTHPSIDKIHTWRDTATAYVYRDEQPRPIIGQSYRDFALVLDYQTDDHDWQHDQSHDIFHELMWSYAQ